MLVCRIVSGPVASVKEPVPEASSKTPQPNPSVADAAAPVVSGDSIQQDDMTLTVRRVKRDGKVVIEVFEPDASPVKTADTPPDSKPEPNHTTTEQRKLELTGCDGKYCHISKFGAFRKKKLAKNDIEGGNGK
ncbi:hypothetical protein [Methanoregula sp.]|uniref:hypothetical protein n=1 Tax=Methanoregula sp. TaxID=2052170 RepID=UPI00236C1D15|nr:hypothetical protein [Methanoregula sp.]MDD1685936.1 hypothetical protein [Methanoregula sp.]